VFRGARAGTLATRMLLPPVSPQIAAVSPRTSPRARQLLIGDETMVAKVQMFLDGWHYQLLRSSIGKSMKRDKVLESALNVLALNGVPIDDTDIRKLMRAEEPHMIQMIVAKMDDGFRESFDSLSEELMTLVRQTVQIRSATDARSEKALFEAIEELDSSGLGQEVLRRSVLEASKEVKHLHRSQETWVRNMENRLDRLTHATDIAEQTQEKLCVVEAQLFAFNAEQNAKSKQVLMSFVSGNKAVLLQTSFAAWQRLLLQSQGETELRDKWEEEIRKGQAMLYNMREKQISNVKNVLMHQAEGSNVQLLGQNFETWNREVQVIKAERAKQEEFQQLQSRLGNFSQAQADKAKQVMSRMGSEQDATLLGITFGAWLKFSADFKKDAEFEESVKRAEAQLKEHMDKKKEEAKAVLDRMCGSTDSGLVTNTFAAWANFVIEDKKMRQMEAEVEKSSKKFKSLQAMHKDSATNVQTRVNDQIRMNLLLRVTHAWQLETKVNRVDKYYTHKLESKRKQLQAVQTLFGSFARDLEEGLKNVDGDSSGRGSKRDRRQGMHRDGAASSLPDIRSRR